MKIRELTISARAKMCLLSAGYEDIEELKNVTDEELQKIRNLNEKGVAEIRTVINTYFAEDEEIEEGESVFDSAELNIDEVELSVRSYNLLKRAGINTIGEICDMTLEELMKVRNMGRKSLEEILTMLKDKGLSLKESFDVDDADEITKDVDLK